jgi:hypothetical protein
MLCYAMLCYGVTMSMCRGLRIVQDRCTKKGFLYFSKKLLVLVLLLLYLILPAMWPFVVTVRGEINYYGINVISCGSLWAFCDLILLLNLCPISDTTSMIPTISNKNK